MHVAFTRHQDNDGVHEQHVRRQTVNGVWHLETSRPGRWGARPARSQAARSVR